MTSPGSQHELIDPDSFEGLPVRPHDFDDPDQALTGGLGASQPEPSRIDLSEGTDNDALDTALRAHNIAETQSARDWTTRSQHPVEYLIPGSDQQGGAQPQDSYSVPSAASTWASSALAEIMDRVGRQHPIPGSTIEAAQPATASAPEVSAPRPRYHDYREVTAAQPAPATEAVAPPAPAAEPSTEQAPATPPVDVSTLSWNDPRRRYANHAEVQTPTTPTQTTEADQGAPASNDERQELDLGLDEEIARTEGLRHQPDYTYSHRSREARPPADSEQLAFFSLGNMVVATPQQPEAVSAEAPVDHRVPEREILPFAPSSYAEAHDSGEVSEIGPVSGWTKLVNKLHSLRAAEKAADIYYAAKEKTDKFEGWMARPSQWMVSMYAASFPGHKNTRASVLAKIPEGRARAAAEAGFIVFDTIGFIAVSRLAYKLGQTIAQAKGYAAPDHGDDYSATWHGPSTHPTPPVDNDRTAPPTMPPHAPESTQPASPSPSATPPPPSTASTPPVETGQAAGFGENPNKVEEPPVGNNGTPEKTDIEEHVILQIKRGDNLTMHARELIEAKTGKPATQDQIDQVIKSIAQENKIKNPDLIHVGTLKADEASTLIDSFVKPSEDMSFYQQNSTDTGAEPNSPTETGSATTSEQTLNDWASHHGNVSEQNILAARNELLNFRTESGQPIAHLGSAGGIELEAAARQLTNQAYLAPLAASMLSFYLHNDQAKDEEEKTNA